MQDAEMYRPHGNGLGMTGADGPLEGSSRPRYVTVLSKQDPESHSRLRGGVGVTGIDSILVGGPRSGRITCVTKQ
jgi:hypothetical protein